MAAPQSVWEWAAAEPERAAIVGDGAQSVGELVSSARRIANALNGAGLVAGDAVAVTMGNSPTTLALILGIQESGLRMVPVSRHLVADEIEYLLGDSRAKAMVVDAAIGKAAADAAGRLASPPEARFAVGGSLAGFESLDDAQATASDAPPAVRQLGGTLFYTSGTTGRPKAVDRPTAAPGTVIPPEAAGAGGAAYAGMFGVEPGGDQVTIVCCPLYHPAPQGWALNALHLGHSVVVPERWTAEGFIDLVERHRVNYTFVVPTQFHRLLEVPEEVRRGADMSSLTRVVHAAAPCPVPIKQRMMDWLGPVIWEFYGGTEGFATIVSPEEWLARPGTVGRGIGNYGVKIYDDEGNECPPGEPGAVFLRGGGFEYRGDPEKTAANRRGDYITLGDVGYLDDEGWLFLLDRRTDLIISGGVNIYPAEVEAVLTSHPLVADAAVFGTPDPDWGQAVTAVVQPREGVAADDELRAELLAECAVKLARIKVPRRLDFRAELPRGDNGKLYKRRLREEYLEAK